MTAGIGNQRLAERRGRERRVPSPAAVVAIVVAVLAGGFGGFLLRWEPSVAEDDTRSNLAQAERLLAAALTSDDTETYARADERFDLVLAQSPQDPRALRGAAVVNLGLHRFADAETEARAALDLRPNDHLALAALVDASIELGRYDQAHGLIDDLISLRPGVQAYTRLSYLHQLRGDDAAALEAMYLAKASASGTQGELARVEALLGELHYEFGHIDIAVGHYSQAIAGDPLRPDYLVGLARALAAQGKSDEAEMLVDQLLLADESDTAALMFEVELQALELVAISDSAIAVVVAAARSELSAGYGVDPSQPLFEATYADPEHALALAELIHDQRPDNVKADHALAWALHRAGRSAEALPHLDAAIRFDTTDAVLHNHAAAIFFATDQPERAIDHRNRANQIRSTGVLG